MSVEQNTFLFCLETDDVIRLFSILKALSPWLIFVFGFCVAPFEFLIVVVVGQ